jgi:hypothetical protein
MRTIGYDISEVEELAGLPAGWTDLPNVSLEERLEALAKQFSPVDFSSVERIARGQFQNDGKALNFPISGENDLISDIADSMSGKDGAAQSHPRNAFLAAIGRRISDLEGE